jgi:hypothetical protein
MDSYCTINQFKTYIFNRYTNGKNAIAWSLSQFNAKKYSSTFESISNIENSSKIPTSILLNSNINFSTNINNDQQELIKITNQVKDLQNAIKTGPYNIYLRQNIQDYFKKNPSKYCFY